MGHTEGTYNVGSCYHDGIGVEKSENKAFIYYQKSADMGHAEGTYKVGYCYNKGIGIEKDENKAFIHYQKSANMGHIGGIYKVGNCYHKGIGVEKNENMAFIYYQKSADLDHVKSTYKVGYCYHNGIGVKKDEYKAFDYYQKSADMGNTVAMNCLANCYDYGIGVERDEYKAFDYYQKSADMGNNDGIFKVGECYRFGIGVEMDNNKATFHYQKSAEMGNIAGIDRVRVNSLLITNEFISPDVLQTAWDVKYRSPFLKIDSYGLGAKYRGHGKNNEDAIARTTNPIPLQCKLFYFEINIINNEENGIIAIGFCTKTAKLKKLPGCETDSWGFHSDNGDFFSCSIINELYGPKFEAGDTIGCCLNFINRTAFYTKNGVNLGIALRDLTDNIYPCIGLSGGSIETNFGHKKFKYAGVFHLALQYI
ncbi:hypothetical protein C2G38_1665840 [Gigaspora rosea]|uniref:B30.2/SPRY domain-containing protein n=1 Tax=Gigaspora rosea TaxID=44941 RepID=A0A397UXK0_9GLOM|nr:hypothetical protein C2G38_1665840 [Gigaspora rosea]